MTSEQSYLITLKPSQETRDSFELDEKNVLHVRVQLPTGEIVDGIGYRVEINLSRDAMLGLGVELIRAAHTGSQEKKLWHMHPSDHNLASQVLGVYLHPSSCELLISQREFGDLQTVLDSSATSSS